MLILIVVTPTSYTFDTEPEFTDGSMYKKLTDGIAASTYWSVGTKIESSSPWVTWRGKNPTIVLQFQGNVSISSIMIHFQCDGVNFIYLPLSIVVGGVTTTLPDSNVNGWKEITGTWLCNTISITLNTRYSGSRISISEIKLQSPGT